MISGSLMFLRKRAKSQALSQVMNDITHCNGFPLQTPLSQLGTNVTLLTLEIEYQNLCSVGLESLTLKMDSMWCPLPQIATESKSLHLLMDPGHKSASKCKKDRKVRSLASTLEMQALYGGKPTRYKMDTQIVFRKPLKE